jgi:hypothetical protein
MISYRLSVAGGVVKGVQPRGGRARARWRRRSPGRRSRAVAEVVGTILILALTVVLFSAIFFFVNTFPRPPTQSSNQFQSTLLYNAAGTKYTGIEILHLSGPTIFNGGTNIYLFQQTPYAALCPASGCTVSQGLGGAQAWTLGQTWTVMFNVTVSAPNNVTATIISNNVLLYSQSVPGLNTNFPPVFNSVSTTTPLVHNTAFTVSAVITDPNLPTNCGSVVKTCGVTLLASGLPSANATGLVKMTYAAGKWSVTMNQIAGVWWQSAAGTYQLMVIATDELGLQNTAVISVTFT